MASDMFIKIGDVKGEAQDKDHKDEIDIYAWSWGMSQSGAGHQGGGSGAGKVSVQDLSFTKPVDKSTPVLMKACAQGTAFPEALLTVRKAGGTKPVEYIKIKLNDVLISNISAAGSPGEDRLMENVSLNFAKFQYDYQPQDAKGAADGGAITMSLDIKKYEIA